MKTATLNNVPQELKRLTQWVCHRDKIPIDAKTGKAASSTDPTTWSSFNQAVEASQNGAGYSGIGFVFNNDFIGVDLDHVVDDDGQLYPWAKYFVNQLNSYTEYSPSRKGLHIFCRGSLATNGCKLNAQKLRVALPQFKFADDAAIEFYSSGRYFTVTGNALNGNREIKDKQALIRQFVSGFQPQKSDNAPAPVSVNPQSVKLPEEKLSVILDNSDKFKRTWEKQRDSNLPSASEYRYSLISQMAQAGWTSDEITAGLAVWYEKHGLAAEWQTFIKRTDNRLGIEIGNVLKEKADQDQNTLDRYEPLRAAENFIEHTQRDKKGQLLFRRHRGDFYQFNSRYYDQLSDDEMGKILYPHLDKLLYRNKLKRVVKVTVTSNTVNEVKKALPALPEILLPDKTDSPYWLKGVNNPDPSEIIPCRNGLWCLSQEKLISLTPNYFCTYGLEFNYNPENTNIERWQHFLNQL